MNLNKWSCFYGGSYNQGAQFTGQAFIGVLETNSIKISMDGKGRWVDNKFIERLWRSVKYEEVYLKEYGSVAELRHGLGKYFKFYNEERPHQSFASLTPEAVYSGYYKAAA